MSISTTPSAWQPTSPAMLSEYLSGEWQLSKELDYRPGGGVDGTFEGKATFEPLACNDGGLRLTYLEDGIASLGGQSMAATKRLLWDFTEEPVRVFFDDTLSRDPEAILDGSRLFHTIELANEAGTNPPPFQHWCSPDTYRGSIAFDSQSCFTISWNVMGPKKDGHIVGRYTRCKI